MGYSTNIRHQNIKNGCQSENKISPPNEPQVKKWTKTPILKGNNIKYCDPYSISNCFSFLLKNNGSPNKIVVQITILHQKIYTLLIDPNYKKKY